MANRRRDVKREALWRGVLKRFTSSGLSIREFCQREGLTESAFYAWRRTIGERDETSRTRPAFVPAVLSDQSAGEASISIELASGCVLRFSGPTALEQLADLVVALQSRCGR